VDRTGPTLTRAGAVRRVETRLPQHGPIADVAVSQVTIDAPLPASAGPHPAACDYYQGRTTIGGRTFAGYVPNAQLAWLRHQGIAQTVAGQYTLLTRELPAAAVRRRKVWCGGHSLGGVVTAFFSMTDFDGDPATLDDAGYNQCAGYFALDTRIATTISGELPQPFPPDTTILPGYQHLDVLTAASRRNDGRAEQGAAALARFVLSH
jgi:hypothetical protein